MHENDLDRKKWQYIKLVFETVYFSLKRKEKPLKLNVKVKNKINNIRLKRNIYNK